MHLYNSRLWSFLPSLFRVAEGMPRIATGEGTTPDTPTLGLPRIDGRFSTGETNSLTLQKLRTLRCCALQN